MKLFTKIHEPAFLMFFFSKRPDSKGFTFGFDPTEFFSFLLIFRFHLQFGYWKIWNYQKPSQLGWNLIIGFGRGAGYKWGRTFYVGRNVKGGGKKWRYNRAPFRIGFTQNANLVPYCFRA